MEASVGSGRWAAINENSLDHVVLRLRRRRCARNAKDVDGSAAGPAERSTS
jgi:hypothetical protein